ncbi:MAG: Smr/MutS family protein [Roseovarius sp.]|nr:Smr/MutS family protein [Roseovarius sp.]
MAGRRPRPDELELWRKVAQNTQQMHADHQRSEHPITNLKTPKPKRQPIEPFTLGQTSNGTAPPHKTLPGIREQVAMAPLQMDKKTFGRLKRGKVQPEGKLDLHGMTMDQAHPRLTQFILRAHASGKRLVLVVTGKGKARDDGGPIPTRLGVLRHNVPQWLAQAPLAQVVLQVSEAHLKHGGGGAYYVYLRRTR